MDSVRQKPKPLIGRRGTRQTTSAGCRLNRSGRRQDRTEWRKDGGHLLTDDGVRLCYEALPLCLVTELWPHLVQPHRTYRTGQNKASGDVLGV
jgi:hypothetical protein